MDRTLIADTWDDIGCGPRAALICIVLAALTTLVAVIERLIRCAKRAGTPSRRLCDGRTRKRIPRSRRSHQLAVLTELGLASILMMVPLLVWFVIFVALPLRA